MVILDLPEFLTPKDIGDEKIVVIIDEGAAGTIRKGEGEVDVKTFELGVEVGQGNRKLWTMNKTSQRTLLTAWGKDTSKWIGKQATLFTVDQNVRGTMKKVIYARTPAAS